MGHCHREVDMDCFEADIAKQGKSCQAHKLTEGSIDGKVVATWRGTATARKSLRD